MEKKYHTCNRKLIARVITIGRTENYKFCEKMETQQKSVIGGQAEEVEPDCVWRCGER